MTMNKAEARRTIESLNAVVSPVEQVVRPLVDERGPLGTLRLTLRTLSGEWKTTHGMQEAVLAVLDAPEWVQAAEEANTLRTQLAHWKVFGEHAEGERSRLQGEVMRLSHELLTRCPTGKCEDPARDCYGSGCLWPNVGAKA